MYLHTKMKFLGHEQYRKTDTIERITSLMHSLLVITRYNNIGYMLILLQFHLVCGWNFLVQCISTVYMAGFLIGAVSSGALSDRWIWNCSLKLKVCRDDCSSV